MIAVLLCPSCGMEGGPRGPVQRSSVRTALEACTWDPVFGTFGCSPNERWAEFSVRDPTVNTMQLEIRTSASGSKVVSLSSRTVLGDGYVKFAGAPGGRLKAGTLVRLLVSQFAAAGGKTATSTWFPYLQGTPANDCVPVCTPTCAANACGVSDGCGGTCGCTSGAVCTTAGTCCVPNTNSCGPDGCGGDHGPCGACSWDPKLGTQDCSQGEWWVEFSSADTVASMQVEVKTATGSRTIALASRVSLGGGMVKFTGDPGSPIAAGTLVRLEVTQTAAAGGQRASSTWFGYLQGAPALDCAQACTPSCAPGVCGVSDGCGGTCGACALGQSCVNNACVCVPSCGANTCGGDGCGGSCGTCGTGTTCQGGRCTAGCVAPWDPSWATLPAAGAWWTELTVSGGGATTTAVVVENVSTGALHSLSYSWGRWTGGVVNLQAGTMVVLRATNALGATAKTLPFRYLVDLAPVTDACGGTAATNTTCAPLSRGLLTFTFDDSGSSQPAIAIPLLQRYGLKGTFFVVPPWHTWITLAQQLAADGHEFAAHGMTHTTLTGLTAQQLDDELRLSKVWIETNIGTPVESFASPSAAWNETVITAAKRYYTSHRTSEVDFNFVGSDVFKLTTDFMYDTTTSASVCEKIRQAAQQKGWYVLTFHDFTTAATATAGFTMPSATFEAILACATTTPGIDVVTTRQGVAKLRCGSPP